LKESIGDFLEAVVEAIEFLEIKTPVTKNNINKKFRERAIFLHPDSGGNSKEFIKLIESRDLLISFVKSIESAVEKYNRKRKARFSSISLLQVRNLLSTLMEK
jgi:hypothetical protein